MTLFLAVSRAGGFRVPSWVHWGSLLLVLGLLFFALRRWRSGYRAAVGLRARMEQSIGDLTARCESLQETNAQLSAALVASQRVSVAVGSHALAGGGDSDSGVPGLADIPLRGGVRGSDRVVPVGAGGRLRGVPELSRDTVDSGQPVHADSAACDGWRGAVGGGDRDWSRGALALDAARGEVSCAVCRSDRGELLERVGGAFIHTGCMRRGVL